MVRLVDDVLLLIFVELQEDPASLHSCILVNKSWLKIAMPILWRSLYYCIHTNSISYKKISFKKLFNTISCLLPSKSLLPNNGFKLSSNRLLFNYLSFFTHISPTFIDDMLQSLIKDEVENYDYKKNLLEEEIYELILDKCKNVKYFYWSTEHSLYLFPNANTFFAKLSSLEINLTFVNSAMLYGLARICQNLETLEINECNKDNSSLVHFINVQTKLKSLSLHFYNVREQCVSLSDAIEGKAATLKRIIIKSSIMSISPKFLISLRNLECLILNNDSQLYEHTKWKEWKHYLSIANFPKLNYLEASQLTYIIEIFLIQQYADKFRSISYLFNENRLIFEDNF